MECSTWQNMSAGTKRSLVAWQGECGQSGFSRGHKAGRERCFPLLYVYVFGGLESLFSQVSLHVLRAWGYLLLQPGLTCCLHFDPIQT